MPETETAEEAAPETLQLEAANEFENVDSSDAQFDRPLVDADSMVISGVSSKSANRAAEIEEQYRDDADFWAEAALENDAADNPSNDQNSVDALFAEVGAVSELVELKPDEALVPAKPPAAMAATSAQSSASRAPGRGKKKRGLLNIGGAIQSPETRRETRFAAISFALLALAIVSALAFKNMIVAAIPQAASVYKSVGLNVNLRGLEIQNVRSQSQDQDGTQVLVVQGQVYNAGKVPREIPRLYLAILGENDQEIYSWTATVESRAIPGGAIVSFRRRLASPPEGSKRVIVRFAAAGETGSSRPQNGDAPPATP
jgi:hypothetical protein